MTFEFAKYLGPQRMANATTKMAVAIVTSTKGRRSALCISRSELKFDCNPYHVLNEWPLQCGIEVNGAGRQRDSEERIQAR